eukprot:TRINITY_DN60192_c0_g2_i1.p1 TRINITY_DN60192_c0_g2~~TRINITY_DN60192_c0_g2_i1.p1  ORF type:complete len:330 (+),score=85.57 TRINITY_DN60192_c0_g2_i1:191-1180(+)
MSRRSSRSAARTTYSSFPHPRGHSQPRKFLSPTIYRQYSSQNSPLALHKRAHVAATAVVLDNRSNLPEKDRPQSMAEKIKARQAQTDAVSVACPLEDRMELRRQAVQKQMRAKEAARQAQLESLHERAREVMMQMEHWVDPQEIRAALAVLDELNMVDQGSSRVAGMRAVALMKLGLMLKDQDHLIQSMTACNTAAELGTEQNQQQAKELLSFLVQQIMNQLFDRFEQTEFEEFDYDTLDKVLKADLAIGVAHDLVCQISETEIQRLSTHKFFIPAQQHEALRKIVAMTGESNSCAAVNPDLLSSRGSDGSCESVDESEAITVAKAFQA